MRTKSFPCEHHWQCRKAHACSPQHPADAFAVEEELGRHSSYAAGAWLCVGFPHLNASPLHKAPEVSKVSSVHMLNSGTCDCHTLGHVIGQRLQGRTNHNHFLTPLKAVLCLHHLLQVTGYKQKLLTKISRETRNWQPVFRRCC